MPLTEQQVTFFETFGYLKLPGLFAGDMASIETAFARTVAAGEQEMIHWQHRAHASEQRRVLPQFIDRDAYLSALIDDPRIDGIFRSVLGDDYCYRGSDANLFDCTTCWHSDTYGALLKYRNVKMIFYLDLLGAETGCFRVIPGSHLFGDRFANGLQACLGKADSFEQDLGLADNEVPCQVVPTRPGDLVLFDFRVKHATWVRDRAQMPHRRMFTICAAQHIQPEDIPRLREEIARGAKFGLTSYYGEQMVKTATAARMVHLQQCLGQEDAIRTID